MSKRRCLRCEGGEMALLGNATVAVTGESSPPRLGASEPRNFLFQIYICPNCGYVEFSR